MAAVLGLAACSDDAAAPEPAAEATARATAEATGERSRPPAAQEDGAAVAGTTLPISYVPDGELDLEVLGFEPADELIRMRMRITARLPSGTDEVSVGAAQIGEEFQGARPVEAELVDTANLKAYASLFDRPDTDAVRMLDGETVTVVLYFAAPEDDVDSFDINLGPQVAPLTDVPYDPS